MTDIELARALEDGTIDNVDFKHFHHLHVAWVYLAESNSIEQATARMGASLRKFADASNVPEKYHQTVTTFWMRVLALLRDWDQRCTLDDWLARIRSCWKKLFHSGTILASGFSAGRLGYRGLSQT
jgi:urease accessory protein UreF